MDNTKKIRVQTVKIESRITLFLSSQQDRGASRTLPFHFVEIRFAAEARVFPAGTAPFRSMLIVRLVTGNGITATPPCAAVEIGWVMTATSAQSRHLASASDGRESFFGRCPSFQKFAST
jgi:hypothetical protein